MERMAGGGTQVINSIPTFPPSQSEIAGTGCENTSFVAHMGYSQNHPSKQKLCRRRSPRGMGGHVLQRAFLLVLVGFLAIYTFVEYISTRRVLSQCAELASYGTTHVQPSTSSSTEGPHPIVPESDSQDRRQARLIAGLESEDEDHEITRVANEGLVTKSPAIAKVTMMYGPQANDETIQLIIEGHKEHAARHGHGIHILDRQLLHGLWSKHAWMLHIMLQEMQKPENMRTKWLA